jgi:hypothetical protein
MTVLAKPGLGGTANIKLRKPELVPRWSAVGTAI